MHYKHYQGIIIYHAPQYTKTLILTREWGMLYLSVRGGNKTAVNRITHGSLVQAGGALEGSRFIADMLELDAQGASWCQSDLNFFHAVLELYRETIPVNSPVPELYDHFTLLYRSAAPKDFIFFKKIFICKFFLLAGLVPEQAMARYLADIITLISLDADSMFECQEDDDSNREICLYVRACFEAHPHAHRFKTRAFFESGLV